MKLPVVLFLLCITAFLGGSDATTPDLRLAAFKVTIFGRAKMSNAFERGHLITIFSRYDLVVLQDIRDATQTSVPALVNLLTTSTGETWDYAISGRLGRTRSKMQYAFVFRCALIHVLQTYQYPDPSDDFEREPFTVQFSAPQTGIGQFSVMAVDTKWSVAETEVDKFVAVYDATSAALGTENILIAGNMDADCDYITTAEWPSVALRHDARFTWLIGDEADTTSKLTTDCAYDRFVVRKGDLKCAIVPGSVNVYNFGAALGLTETQAREVSWHYPIELRIYGH